jgi:DNA-binding transcriptional MerR regulator
VERGFYPIGQFARKASVSVRTVRYYDAVGLLSPSRHTEAGYRLYTDEDLSVLQQILALKFLGFSLEEIRACLEAGSRRLDEALSRQKAMMREQRAQIDAIIQAIEGTERLLRAGHGAWEAVVRVIEAIQMDQKNDWVNKYFTEEQRQKMEEISERSYSEEAKRKMAPAQAAWTEADQQRADEQWGWVDSELRRLAAAKADPAGPEAQAWAKVRSDLLAAFTQNDPDIEAGLNQWWQNFSALPESERPFQAPQYSSEETELMEQAMTIYKQRQA